MYIARTYKEDMIYMYVNLINISFVYLGYVLWEK